MLEAAHRRAIADERQSEHRLKRISSTATILFGFFGVALIAQDQTTMSVVARLLLVLALLVLAVCGILLPKWIQWSVHHRSTLGILWGTQAAWRSGVFKASHPFAHAASELMEWKQMLKTAPPNLNLACHAVRSVHDGVPSRTNVVMGQNLLIESLLLRHWSSARANRWALMLESAVAFSVVLIFTAIGLITFRGAVMKQTAK